MSLAAAIPDLQARCRALARNGLDGDDLLSLTLERVVRYSGSYDPTKPVLPWLWGIARNASLSAWDRSGSPVPEESEVDRARMRALDPADVLERESFSERVTTALVALSEKQRKALVLWGAMGFSVGEVADSLGLRPEATRSIIRRAITAFRAVFGPKARSSAARAGEKTRVTIPETATGLGPSDRY